MYIQAGNQCINYIVNQFWLNNIIRVKRGIYTLIKEPIDSLAELINQLFKKKGQETEEGRIRHILSIEQIMTNNLAIDQLINV